MKLRITQTLLSSWLYSFKTDEGYESFLKTLKRIKEPPTKAMLDGVKFEGLVNETLNGTFLSPENELYDQVKWCAEYLQGAQQQVTIFQDIKVKGVNFILHGVLDFLRNGVIYDTKFSKTYEIGKYFDSPQTPMYFALVPEARKFEYVICDGNYVYRESYIPEEVLPIEYYISGFMDFLENQNLVEIYADKWRIKE